MYRGYEPNAIMIEASGRIVRLFTYDACRSLKEAKQVIKKWNEDNELVSSYIQHSWDKKKVCCKFYEDRLSYLEYGGYRLCR